MEYKLTYDEYRKKIEQEEISGLLCQSCGTVTFPPLAVCRNCGGTDLEVTRIEGEGTVRTFTVIRVAPQGRKPPYVVAMVELKEGPWVTGNLIDIDPDKADMNLIGKKVSLGSHVVKGDTYSGGDSRVITFSLMEP